jgi:hypothetical protein
VRYILRADTSTNPVRWKIKQGRRLVGSVRRAEQTPGYVGRIGEHAATGETAEIAFREVAAMALGFANASALAEHNRRARAHNRTIRSVRRERQTNVVPVGPIDDEPYAE